MDLAPEFGLKPITTIPQLSAIVPRFEILRVFPGRILQTVLHDFRFKVLKCFVQNRGECAGARPVRAHHVYTRRPIYREAYAFYRLNRN